MKNLINAEFYYLFKNIKFYIFLVLVALGNICAIIFNQSIILPIVQVATFIFAAILILEFSHKDFNNKTMKNYVGSGIPLFKVYFAKLIVCLCSVLGLLIVLQITYTIAGMCLQTVTDVNILNILMNIIINLLRCSVVIFICCLIPSAPISIIVSLLYFIVLPAVIDFIPLDIFHQIRPFMLDNILTNFTEETQAIGSQIIHNAAVGFNPEVGFHLFVSVIVVTAISLLGAYLFSKREVK